VPAITAALTRLRGFAHLNLSKPVIRKGKSGHFCDRALDGVSHHAVVPNVNVLDDDLEKRLARLSDDEKRLFAIICRSYLAAVMPDHEYRQTAVTLCVPAPPGDGAEFRAVGRIPLAQGWKTVYGASEPDAAGDETEQTLPPLTDVEMAQLTEPRIDAKRTQAPPRYNEGTLIDAMQNAWRFVENPAVRERLKEANRRRGAGARRSGDETAMAKPSRRKAASAKPKRPRGGKAVQAGSAPETSAAMRAAPTARMVAYAEKLAKTKKLPLPPGYAQDFQACRRFLDQNG
jgi:DNA topoisomerase